MSGTIHTIVTGRMIAALERGTVPWRKPWHAATGQPRSMSTSQPYRGVNVFLLAMTAAEHGYTSPFWGTYRQITALGGQVHAGERSTLVVFWKKTQTGQRDPQTGETTTRTVPVLRYYRVFNATQTSHLPGHFHPTPSEHRPIAGPQAVLDAYLATGPRLLHVAGDRAAYHPATDTIRLPQPAQFQSPEAYYATAFHEAGHSTGHPTRLNRPGVAAFDHFGSGRYAREELAAEMTSALLCAQTGIDTPDLFGNSASYIASWLTALHNDHKLVITAAAQAQHASDLITQPQHQPTKDSTQHTTAAGDEAAHVTGSTAALTSAGRAPAGHPARAVARMRGNRSVPAPLAIPGAGRAGTATPSGPDRGTAQAQGSSGQLPGRQAPARPAGHADGEPPHPHLTAAAGVPQPPQPGHIQSGTGHGVPRPGPPEVTPKGQPAAESQLEPEPG